jgi:hypothetical protein
VPASEAVVIEVLCLETGDRAEATDERGAIQAARTLCRDAAEKTYCVRPSVAFIVDGVTVRIVKGVEL